MDLDKRNHGCLMDSAIAGQVDEYGNVPRRVYVGGMPFWYTEEDIRTCWEECGPIESLSMLSFPDTGNFRGIVFITFETDDAFLAALSYHGEELDGKTLVVKRCVAPAGHVRDTRELSQGCLRGTSEQPARGGTGVHWLASGGQRDVAGAAARCCCLSLFIAIVGHCCLRLAWARSAQVLHSIENVRQRF
jgi:hypothetical protein